MPRRLQRRELLRQLVETPRALRASMLTATRG